MSTPSTDTYIPPKSPRRARPVLVLGCVAVGLLGAFLLIAIFWNGLFGIGSARVTPTLATQISTVQILVTAPRVSTATAMTVSTPLSPTFSRTPTSRPIETRSPTPTRTRVVTRTPTPEPRVACERTDKGFTIEERTEKKFKVRFQITCTNPFDGGRELDLGILIVLQDRTAIGDARFQETRIAANSRETFTSKPYETSTAPSGNYIARVRYKGNHNQDETFEIPFP